MKFLILGGGISGLTAAWYLRKHLPDAKITLIEKEHRLGGWIHTMDRGGSLFERGPRTFAVSRSASLLRLISELGLQDEILFSNPDASIRYLWEKGSLRSMGSLVPRLIFPLIRESFLPKKQIEDESIYDFAKRRFNHKIAETFFDPMVLGIYSGDMRRLSLQSCFPFLYQWEQEGRSIISSLFRSKQDGRLFSLKRGIESLIHAMVEKLDIDFVLNTSVESLTDHTVYAGGNEWDADRIISALPGPVIGRLTKTWPDFPSNSIWIVHLGFKIDLKKKGFGYLVPTKEKESVLGVVWDSSIFPRKGGAYATIMTMMVRNRGDKSWAEGVAKKALEDHLGCFETPDFVEAHFANEAIPQFEVGYKALFLHWKQTLQSNFPKLELIGNYVDGVSVDACIHQAESLILKMVEKSIDTQTFLKN